MVSMREDEIIGHERIIDVLERAIANRHITNAYLFVGPAHVGKRTVAEWFAARLLGVVPTELKAHPDYFFVERGVNEKTGRAQQEIPVEQIRTLREALSRHAFHGGKKVAIIRNAHTLSIGAVNALLKTLEEPYGDTVIILTALHKRMLPQTIISRSVTLQFCFVPQRVIIERLRSYQVSEQDAHVWASIAAGRPGVAHSLLHDVEYRTTLLKDTQAIATLLAGELHERLHIIEKRVSKEDTIAAREDADQFVSRCLEYLHRTFHGQACAPTQYREAADALLEARMLLKGNVQTRLALEYAALHC